MAASDIWRATRKERTEDAQANGAADEGGKISREQTRRERLHVARVMAVVLDHCRDAHDQLLTVGVRFDNPEFMLA